LHFVKENENDQLLKNDDEIKTKMIDEEMNKNEKEFLNGNICIFVLF